MGNENKTNKTKRTITGLSRYSCKNLRFMLDFLSAIDKTPETAMGNPSAAVTFRSQLHQDNMLLSRAREIIEGQGYKLEVKEKEQENDVITIIMENAPKKNKLENLAFLEDMINQKRLTKAALASLIDLPAGTVRAWFNVDDIRIAYLTLIAERLGMILEYKIVKA